MPNWFPFGAAACSRYEFLNRVPLLPHEELLCKEATAISQGGPYPRDSPRYRQHNHVKVAFVALMRSQLQAHEGLKQRGARLATSSVTNVLCNLCKHCCYIAYTVCKCCPEPTCLNHDRVFSDCKCGTLRSLIVRDDLRKLQAVAQTYESEDEVMDEVLKGPSICDSFVASAGSGVGEEVYLTRSLSSVPDFSNRLNRVSSLGEQRPNLCEAKTCIQAASLDSKMVQEEDSSDSEAFRVKRRRVLPSHTKRFQVDEQVLSPRKLLKSGLEVNSLVMNKKSQLDSEMIVKEKKPESIIKGRLLIVEDIINDLAIKGSRVEVIGRWQHDARIRGLTIKIKKVPLANRLVEAMSLKSCMSLKQLLMEDQATRLEMLMQQVHRPSIPMVNSSCSIQGDNEPASIAAPVSKKVVLDGKKGTYKCAGRCISDDRQTFQEAVSEMHVVNCTVGLVKEDADSDVKHPSLHSHGINHQDGMLGRRKRWADDETCFFEGSSNNTEFRCRKQILKVKVKGPTPPVLSCETSLIKKHAGQVDNESKIHDRVDGNVDMRCTIRNSEEIVGQCAGSEDHKELGSAAKNGKDHGRERTQVTLGTEQRKTFVVRLSRKVDQKGGLVDSSSADSKQERDKKFGKDDASIREPATSWCSKEAVSACTITGSSLEHQMALDVMEISGVSSQHTCMAVPSNSRVLPLGNVSEEGEAKFLFCETGNHVGSQHADDFLSQRVEHNLDKFASVRNVSDRASKSAAERVGKDMEPLCNKSALSSSFESGRCFPRENSHFSALSPASCNQQGEECSREVKDAFTRLPSPDKSCLRDDTSAKPRPRAHSPPGSNHFRNEAQAGCDHEEQAGKNDRWRNSRHMQHTSPPPRSFIVSDRSTANISHRNGALSRPVARRKPFFRSKFFHQAHHYPRIDHHPRVCQGQDNMLSGNKAQKFRSHSFRNNDVNYEGESYSDNARTRKGLPD